MSMHVHVTDQLSNVPLEPKKKNVICHNRTAISYREKSYTRRWKNRTRRGKTNLVELMWRLCDLLPVRLRLSRIHCVDDVVNH